MLDKSKMKCNQPHRTPNDPKKSHVVKACYDGKEKIIHFGQQGAVTAGKPKEGESERMKMKRKSFKARHAQNIAKGPSSAAYWANKVKWATGGKVDVKNKPAEMRASPQNPVLGALAKGVKGLKDLAGRYQIDSSMPLVGGVGIDEILNLPGAAREVERWSYGNYPMQIPEMSNVPQMKTGRQSDVADVALFGMEVAGLSPFSKTAAKYLATKINPKTVADSDELRPVGQTDIPTEQMLMGLYRGYAGDIGDESKLYAAPSRAVAEYYAKRRSAETGLEPHVEQLMVDPFAGRQYGLSIPMDQYNREPLTTMARELKPKDIQNRYKLYGAGAGLTYNPDEINAIADEFNRQYQ